MRKHLIALGGASLLLGVSMLAAQAQIGDSGRRRPTHRQFDAQGTPNFVGISDIIEYKALPEYHEPDFVKAFVDAGKLPPVKDRLPKEPMVFKTSQHARRHRRLWRRDASRHRRPSGRLELHRPASPRAGAASTSALSECLTRTGPLFEVKADELEPMPNLAKSWEWSRRRPQADHAPDRRRQVVGRRAVHLRRRHVLLGRQRRRPERVAAERRNARDLRRGHDACRRSTSTRSSGPSRKPSRPSTLPDGLRHVLPRPGAHLEAAASQVQVRPTPTTSTRMPSRLST